MGVMPCSKEGCEHILCRRYNEEFGYICDDCLQDLIKYCNIKKSTSPETIREFLELDKSLQYGDDFDSSEILHKIFR
jgi:hypothetical protein